jgi:hypothetical protein
MDVTIWWITEYVEGGGSTVVERNNILEGYMEFDLIRVGGG